MRSRTTLHHLPGAPEGPQLLRQICSWLQVSCFCRRNEPPQEKGMCLMYGYSTLLPYLPALFHDLYILAGGWVYIEPQCQHMEQRSLTGSAKLDTRPGDPANAPSACPVYGQKQQLTRPPWHEHHRPGHGSRFAGANKTGDKLSFSCPRVPRHKDKKTAFPRPGGFRVPAMQTPRCACLYFTSFLSRANLRVLVRGI